MADSGIPAKFQAFAAIVTAENGLYRRIMDLLGRWATRLRTAVFGARPAAGPLVHAPDPIGVRSTASWFATQLDGVLVEVKEIFDDAAEHATDLDMPDDTFRTRQAVDAARNRLVRVPDTVFRLVNAEVMKATTQGWSIDELAGEVDSILAEAGAERWQNRARTIARTEAVAAYNAGTYAGFQSYAQAVGGQWDKVWLETHDHRTRTTHREVTGFGGQRVPLGAMFVANGVEMPYPGWPGGPPQEVINCRCSLLLARRDETIDYSNRHYKGNR